MLGISQYIPFVGRGIGISKLAPFIIYGFSFLCALISLFLPIVGVFFLFPLIPYQILVEKLRPLFLGKDINDIVLVCILIGTFFQASRSWAGKKPDPNLPFQLKFFIFISIVAFGVGLVTLRESLAINNLYVMKWKEYITFPLIWILTVKNIQTKKQILMMIGLMTLGILGVDYYFRNNLEWMNVWHYTNRAKTLMNDMGLFGSLGANHYGAFFAHFVFIFVGLFLFVKRPLAKLALLGSIIFTIYCLLYSFSRGAYFGVLAGLVFIGIVKDKRIFVLLIICFLFWRQLLPISVVERVEMTQDETGELDVSAAERLGYWDNAIGLFVVSPVLGHGFYSFEYFTGRDAHNVYFKLLAEQGVLGLIALLCVFQIAFLKGWRLYRKSKDWLYQGLGLGLTACIVSIIVTNMFGDRWSYLPLNAYFWVLFGLVVRAEAIESELVTNPGLTADKKRKPRGRGIKEEQNRPSVRLVKQNKIEAGLNRQK